MQRLDLSNLIVEGKMTWFVQLSGLQVIRELDGEFRIVYHDFLPPRRELIEEADTPAKNGVFRTGM